MRISDWSSDVCSSDLASHNRYTASGASGSPGSLVNLSHFNMHLYCIYQFAGIHAARIHDWRRLVSMSGDILDKQIGRETCRERESQYVEISVGDATIKKKITLQ